MCALLEQGELVGRRRGHVRACPVTATLHAAGRGTHALGLAGRVHHVIRTALQRALPGCDLLSGMDTVCCCARHKT